MIKKTDKSHVNTSLLFYIINALYWFSLYTYGSVLSNHAADLGADAAMIGLISGSYGFAMMLLRLPIGVFSDRIKNRKWFIGAGLLLSCISGIGLGLAETPGQLLVFRSIAGAAAAMFVVFASYITEMGDKGDNHKTMGTLSAVNKTGRMIALFTGGLIVQLFGGKWAFLTGGLAAGLTILIWTMLPVDKYHEDHKDHSIRELLEIVKDKDLASSAGLTIFFQFAVFASTYTFTPVIARNLGMSDISIGFLTSLFTLTGILSALLSGTVFKKYIGTKRTVAVSFALSGIFFVFMPFVKSVIMLYCLQIAAGLTMGLILPLLMGESLKNIPSEKKGTAMGFYQALYGIGMVSGPYAVGLTTRYLNIRIGYIMVLAICTGAAALTYLYGREDRLNGLAKY